MIQSAEDCWWLIPVVGSSGVDLVQGHQDNCSPTRTSDPDILGVNSLASDQPPAISNTFVDITDTYLAFGLTEVNITHDFS
jgi:hypothetical protein